MVIVIIGTSIRNLGLNRKCGTEVNVSFRLLDINHIRLRLLLIFQADPCAKQPRALDVYLTLCDNIEGEAQTRKHIRDRETDINGYLKQRFKELTEPILAVALFDTERNDAAKKGWKEQVC